MTHAVTLNERRPARCACGLLCLALALLLFALVMPSAASASISTGAGGAAVLSSAPPSLATDLPAGAVIELGTVDWTRTSSYGGGNWAQPDFLSYYTDSAGSLAIVARDATAGTLVIDTFDPSTLQRIGDTRSISTAGWPDWGGFYAGPDGCFYVLVGRENPNEDDTLDVVAVRRYDRDWTLLGTAYVQGGAPMGIFSPLAFSASHMVLVGNRLVVHTGRLIYAYEGVHHQVNLTFEVDVDTMTATTFDRFDGWPYSSHSFQQLVVMNGSDLVTIDHGDAYPRAIQMGVIADYPTQRRVSTFDLFEFNGAIGDNFTGATVTGLVSGPLGIVVVGNSIRHPDAPNGTLGSADEHRNVYAIWADPATGAHTARWLTDFAPQGVDDALEPRVVRVGPDRYAVLFSVHNDSGYRMEYRLIDSAGTVLASTSFPGAFFCAASDPILVGGTVNWVGIEPDTLGPPVPAYLFEIDVSDPTTPSLIDSTPPTTTASGASATAWYRTARTITLTATDNEGGSGVAKIEFKLDAASWTPGTSVTVSAPADHSADGEHTVSYRSVDAVGNVEATKTCTVRIDTTAPTGTFTLAGGAVTTSVTAVSATSGVSDAHGPLTMRFSLDAKASWSAWESYAQTKALTLPEGAGEKTVVVQYTDTAGNLFETSDAIELVEAAPDSVGPVTYAKAASGRVGRTLRLRYMATDDQSSLVWNVRLVVKNARSRTVRSFRTAALVSRSSGGWYAFKWKPTVRGTYRYRVYAEDTAGNRQRRVGSAKVVVK